MRRHERGLSLVELMVAMLIGLIGIIIITHLYITNDRYKRSTTGSGTAQVNGAIALYVLERDIRMAGFGLNFAAALGCSCAGAGCSPVQYHYKGAYSYPPAGGPGGALPPLIFAPVVITDSAGAPDAITVLFGSDLDRMLPAKLVDSMPNASAEYKVDGTAGFGESDMVMVTSGSTCVLTQITEVQSASAHLQHRPGANVSWNPQGGGSLFPKFDAGATLFNLGNPTWRMYSIAGNRLQAAEVLTIIVPGGAPTALVDEIVDLQAEYGKDTNSDGSVDTWNATPPANAAEWLQVLAVRLGVLVRSQNFEKPSVAGGPCEATPAVPAWTGSVNANSVFTVPGGLPSCYKHRVFETVVPIRNMIWRPA